MARVGFAGPVASVNSETDGEIWIPSAFFRFDSGTWTWTRSSAGIYYQRKTAADETVVVAVDLSQIFFRKIGTDPNTADNRVSHAIRGVQVKNIDVVYAIATADLDAHTYDVHETTYANNTAPSVVSTIGGTLSGTLATATQAQPYLSTISNQNSAFDWVIGSGGAASGGSTTRRTDTLEITVNAAATSVYDIYGVFVRFNYNVL